MTHVHFPVDSSGAIVVAGATNINNLLMSANAYAPQCGCTNLSGAGFLVKIAPGGAQLVWGTYLPLTTPSDGLMFNPAVSPTIKAIAFDASENVILTGKTPQNFRLRRAGFKRLFPSYRQTDIQLRDLWQRSMLRVASFRMEHILAAGVQVAPLPSRV